MGSTDEKVRLTIEDDYSGKRKCTSCGKEYEEVVPFFDAKIICWKCLNKKLKRK